MAFLYNSGTGKGYVKLFLEIGSKWADVKNKSNNSALKSVFDKVDNSDGIGDGIIQKEEISLLRKLFSTVDGLLSSNQEENANGTIEDDEMSSLNEKIKSGEININKLREEVEKEKDIKYKYPNFEDITPKFNSTTSGSNYKFQVFKTNTQKCSTNTGGFVEYNSFVLKFQDPKTNSTQEINLHIDVATDDKSIDKIIKSILEQCDDTAVDLMCNELEDLYITSQKNNKQKRGGKTENYGNLSHSTKAAAFYHAEDESINIYNSGKAISLNTFIHELGHAKDSGSYNTGKLFELINPHKSSDYKYFLTSAEEMYAEFFKSYSIVQKHVKQQVNEKYGDIISKLPENYKQSFIQEVSVSLMTEENKTISSILDRVGLSEYKKLFGDKVEQNIELSIPSLSVSYDLNQQLSYIRKSCKKNPEIIEYYNNFIRDIADAYNHPQNAKKSIAV